MSTRGSRSLRRVTLGAVALLTLGALAFALLPSRGVTVDVARAGRADILVPILCDGTLEPGPGGEVRAEQPATVAEILAREGQRVGKATVLLRLDEPELQQKAREARALALQLGAERGAVAAEVSALEAEVKHRRELVEADRRLLEEAAITRLAAESDALALGQAEERLRSAQARLEALAGGPRSRLALAEAAAADLERRASALTVRAPVEGVVYGLPRRVGEAVATGQVLAGLVDPAHRQVRARVDQPDLPRVAIGQRLIVTFDGIPDGRWEGKVAAVSPGLRESGGREVGEVLSEIKDPTTRLPPNASVNVQIVAGEKSNALVIPRAALYRDGGRRYVYRLRDGRARQQEVTLGLVGLNEVEVVSGLAEGERVILPPAAPLSDGERVVARGG